MVPSRPSLAALGALAGVAPGAAACVAYVCPAPWAQGDPAVVGYETYILPSFAGIGAAEGALVGAGVGWVCWGRAADSGTRRPARLVSAACRLAVGGALGGGLLAALAFALLGAALEVMPSG